MLSELHYALHIYLEIDIYNSYIHLDTYTALNVMK